MENVWRQQSNPIFPSHLPSQIFAPERLSELLTHGSYDAKHKVKKPAKKVIKYTTTTTTTRPPIVWFPGDPDCNDAATSSKNSIPRHSQCRAKIQKIVHFWEVTLF